MRRSIFGESYIREVFWLWGSAIGAPPRPIPIVPKMLPILLDRGASTVLRHVRFLASIGPKCFT